MKNFQIGDVLDVGNFSVCIVRSVEPFKGEWVRPDKWDHTIGYTMLGVEYFIKGKVIGNIYQKSNSFNSLYEKLQGN